MEEQKNYSHNDIQDLRVRIWDKKKKKLYKWGFSLDPDGNVFTAGRRLDPKNIVKSIYVGFSDREETPIFTGDILEDPYGNRAEAYWWEGDKHVIGGFSLRTYGEKRHGWDAFETSWLRIAKIIGNIYEEKNSMDVS